jgi:nitroreductase
METTTIDLRAAIYGRRAIRNYTEQPVSLGELEMIVDAAIQAPSFMDTQPWSFAIVVGASRLTEMSDRAKREFPRSGGSEHALRAQAQLDDPAFDIFHGAPALLVICAVNEGSQAAEDCCLAAQNAMLAAYAAGFGTCPIGFARPWLRLPEVKRELGIPAEHVPVFAIAVGHAAQIPVGPPRRKAAIFVTG